MVLALPRTNVLELDAKRIAANSFVIALHAAALGLLMMPTTWTPPSEISDSDPPMVVVPEVIKTKPQDPIPLRESRTPQPTPLPQQITPPQATTQAQANTEVVDNLGTEIAVLGNPPNTSINIGNSEPGLAQLVLLNGPAPHYPRQALRDRLQGEVLLRVLVDANGLPEDVIIERSSGHRLLDQAALREVRASWRFQPAIVDGRNVPAYALVPINFRLSN